MSTRLEEGLLAVADAAGLGVACAANAGSTLKSEQAARVRRVDPKRAIFVGFSLHCGHGVVGKREASRVEMR